MILDRYWLRKTLSEKLNCNSFRQNKGWRTSTVEFRISVHGRLVVYEIMKTTQRDLFYSQNQKVAGFIMNDVSMYDRQVMREGGKWFIPHRHLRDGGII